MIPQSPDKHMHHFPFIMVASLARFAILEKSFLGFKKSIPTFLRIPYPVGTILNMWKYICSVFIS